MPRAVYLQPGDVLGAYRVLAVPTPAPDGRDRLYHVETTCCHTEVVRSHRELVKCRRVGRPQCPRCTQAARRRGFGDHSPLIVGDVVGPVTIIALDEPLWRQVQWACCGGVETVSVNRLHQLKHRHKNGFQQLCGECNRKMARPRYMGPWMRATATLPTGIIPAGAAWPRPGARA